MSADPYQTLGVAPTATEKEIKDAYRKLAKKLHPDLNPGNKDAEKRFKQINLAYEQVGTAENRAKFDRGETAENARPEAGGREHPFYHQTQQGGGRYSYSFDGVDDDLLHSIFGQMGGKSRAAAGGRDVLYQMEVAFKDALLGAESEITLPGGKRLRVKIPAGVETGTRLRFPGHGSPAEGAGHPAGGAYVELNVQPSPLFNRSGADLELELPISLSESILGAQVKVPTLEGSIVLTIPSGASNGQRLRVAGKGGGKKGGGRGDLFVILKLVAPKETDADFKEAVAAWAKRHPSDVRAHWIGSRGDAL